MDDLTNYVSLNPSSMLIREDLVLLKWLTKVQISELEIDPFTEYAGAASNIQNLHIVVRAKGCRSRSQKHRFTGTDDAPAEEPMRQAQYSKRSDSFITANQSKSTMSSFWGFNRRVESSIFNSPSYMLKIKNYTTLLTLSYHMMSER